MTNYEYLDVDINKLRRCPIELRTVKKETLEYIQLKDSIKDVGLLNPLICRPSEEGYEVVCGFHRHEVALDLRLETVPIRFRPMTDSEVECIQMIENDCRVPTMTSDSIRRLQGMLNRGEKTINELAHSIHRHPNTLKKWLKLNFLSPKWKKLLDNGDLWCILAVELAKLPIEKQDNLLSLHSQYLAKEFLELLRQEVREFRGESRKERGRQKSGILPRYRQWGQVLNEYLNPTEKATVLTRCGANTASEGWDSHQEWTLCMDAETVAKSELLQQQKDSRIAKKIKLRNLEISRRKENDN